MFEKIAGSSVERAAQRLERAQAELQRLEIELEELRQKRDRLLVEDSPQNVIAAVRAQVRSLEAARSDALEDLSAAQKAAVKARADAEAREREKRRKRRDELMVQRLAAAREVQAGAMQVCAGWNRLAELTRQLGGVIDTKRPTQDTNAMHEGAQSAVHCQLTALSDGALGDVNKFPSMRFNSYSEFLRKAPDVVGTVELQHSRVVNAEQKAA
ncbi:MAG: hypothetical protein ABI423_11910 [Burkholderiales bacterium]